MNAREELVKKLEEFAGSKCLDHVDIPEMADFIIADRLRVVEPLVQLKKKWNLPRMLAPRYSEAIEETLKLAGVI